MVVDKTITLLLQLSLIIPFVMVVVAALIGCRILKGHPRWPALIGVSLTSIIAVTSTIFFSPVIHNQSYSQTLINWISLSGNPEVTVTIGVLFDPLSLSFYLIVSMASLFYLVLKESFEIPRITQTRATNGYASLLYLMCFFATVGCVLSTNFLQLLIFWFMLSMSLNLLHEVNLVSDTLDAKQSRHWWGWNAFSDVMLLLSVFLIGINFGTWNFLQCLQFDAIQAAHIKNSSALPGIGAALFLAAVPRLGLFPASMMIIGNERPWSASSLAALNLLSVPAGMFLLLRCAPMILAVTANQMLLIQAGTVSALLTVLSACSLTRTQHLDRFIYWISATLAGTVVAVTGMNADHAQPLIPTVTLLYTCVMAVLIPMINRRQTGLWPAMSHSSIKACYLLSVIAILVGLSLMLNPLITVRTTTDDIRTEIMVWLILLISFCTSFGLAQFYFSLNSKPEPQTASQKIPVLPLWGISLFLCLTSVSVLFRFPFLRSIWPELITDTNTNPFDQDWLFCSLAGLTIMLSLILAWMTASKVHRNNPADQRWVALINLGQSHFYSLNILNRAVIAPLVLLAKIISLLDYWLLSRLSRASIEQTPRYWGRLLKQMQNGQIAFETLVLLFTLSIFIIVLLVLQI